MKICVAQSRPLKGDIQANIVNHKKLVALAVEAEANVIVFPELSLSGYEPELAKELAMDVHDARLNDFQAISDANSLTVGVGAPVASDNGICIGMIVFQPHRARQLYAKKYLHTSEDEFFVSGQGCCDLEGDNADIALAICYELSVPEHSKAAYKRGAKIYIASVVEDAGIIDKSLAKLSDIARKYSMTVVMSNCVGSTGQYIGGGRSSAWNNNGQLAGQLDDSSEGILMIDTDTGVVVKRAM